MTMVAPRAVARRPTRSGRSAPYVFVAPVVALFTLSIAVPIGYAIYLSLLTVKVSGLGLGAGAGARKEMWG